MSIYRKIYEQQYGPIPVDENGKSFHIHHIDGNRKNNNITNLIALSERDHYDLHFKQGDYGACNRLSYIMNMSQEEKSQIATLSNKSRLENDNHPFLRKDFQKNIQKRLIDSGEHHLLKFNFEKITCPVCGKSMNKGNYVKYKHGPDCGKK